jgi:hypothetical protein
MQSEKKMKNKREPDRFLDDEEREIIESFEAAIDDGKVFPKSPDEVKALNLQWQQILRNSTVRKAITLRVQERDIERLKSIARRKGMPYQTLVTSVLHQFANGDLIER